MTEETNKPTEAASADAAKADEGYAEAPDTASQLPNSSEETPVVRERVVSEQRPTSSDRDDDRSPGVVGRTGSTSPETTDVPVIRKPVVSNPTSQSSDPDDDRSPGVVGRSAGEVQKRNEGTQPETEANESKNKEDTE
ncbi:MAG: hypothetical protein KME43_23245 [Myxacorys chilensis ATA2-1-KO14]|jgi:hypothetical protein|nr:hypothetical protein [Myxacorys chilensis ATA2-1-KO14]